MSRPDLRAPKGREDDRIWYPDFNDHIDWSALWDAGQARYSESPEATWWIQATAGVNYYRAWMPAKYLPGKWVGFEMRDLQEDADGNVVFPRQEGDTAIWLFPGNMTRGTVMAGMKMDGIRVIVEVDDNYTVGPPGVLQRDSTWQNMIDRSGQDNHSYEAHRRICQTVADAMIVSTPKLADVYASLCSEIHVCPNMIDPADWPDEEPEHAPDGILRVGWAGSDSHIYDVNDMRLALDWASRQKDVEVVVMGRLKPIENCTVLPWADSLADYRAALQKIDVMLCPLRPGLFPDCKSDIKAMEGAMAGAVPVVSKTEPYRPWWDSDAPCLVAEKPKDFVKAVKELVSDRDTTKEMAREARAWVLEHRSIEHGINNWREAIAV